MSEKRSYIDLLKDPRWQRRRLEILERDGWKCTCCENEKRTLHVHHRKYERGKLPWEASDQFLVTLCEDCHEATSHWKKIVDACIADIGPEQMSRVAGYLQGLLLLNGDVEAVACVDGEQLIGIADTLPNRRDQEIYTAVQDGALTANAYNALWLPKP